MIKTLKQWLRARLAKALASEIEQELAVNQNFKNLYLSLNDKIWEARQAIEQNLAENVYFYPVEPWYRDNYWEPNVQLALRDLCCLGDVVFDVGANFGGLTTVMSRLVGQEGVVCAFEASPRIIDKCQSNLVLNGCHNVQVFFAAVYRQSYQTVPIYLGTHLNDSIYATDADKIAAYHVPTIALDDFVSYTGLVPNLVKMDIEGAEFDAVQGMLKTISTAKPHLILETQPHDNQCLNLLRDKGYIAIDLSTYQEINGSEDYPTGVTIANNLYIHQTRINQVIYQPPFKFIEVASLNQENFVTHEDHSISLKTPVKLEKGRYLIVVDFTAQGTDNELTCGIKVDSRIIFRYHAYSQLLAGSYRHWVVHLFEPASLNIYFQFLKETDDETLLVKGCKISEIQDFKDLKPPLYC